MSCTLLNQFLAKELFPCTGEGPTPAVMVRGQAAA